MTARGCILGFVIGMVSVLCLSTNAAAICLEGEDCPDELRTLWASLDQEEAEDNASWSAAQPLNEATVLAYLEGCKQRRVCQYTDAAEREIDRLRGELALLWASLNREDEAALVVYLDRCSSSTLCESIDQAQTTLSSIQEKRERAEDNASWNAAQPLSEATALAYLEGCEQRSVCQYREIAAPFSLEYQTTRDAEAWAATDQEDIASLTAYLTSCSDGQV